MGELGFRVLWVVQVDPSCSSWVAPGSGSGEEPGLKRNVYESCSIDSFQKSALQNGWDYHSTDGKTETQRD